MTFDDRILDFARSVRGLHLARTPERFDVLAHVARGSALDPSPSWRSVAEVLPPHHAPVQLAVCGVRPPARPAFEGWIEGGRAVLVETFSTNARRWSLSHRLKGEPGAELRRAAAFGVIAAIVIERRLERRPFFYCVPAQAAPWVHGAATWGSLRSFLSNTNPLLPITRWPEHTGPFA